MSKTFVRTAALISLLIFVVLLVFSFAAFKSFEAIVVKKSYDENIKELRIISDSIKSMHESVRNFTFKLMDDTTLEPLFQRDNIEFAEMYRYMSNLSKSFEMNPIFHSVSLYSGNSGKCYSTATSKANMDTFFVYAIDNYQNIQVLTPMCRMLPPDIYYSGEIVFTYLYFQTDSQNNVKKAMAVNMNAAWLCEFLNRLKGTSSKAYIIDRKSGIYIDESKKIKSLDEIDPQLVKKIMESGENNGSFITGRNKEQKLFTYLWMKDTDWMLVVEEPNTFLYQSVKIVRKVIVQIALSTAILALVAVLFVSRTIYNPFGKLFRQVVGQVKRNDSRIKLVDDVKLISEAFSISQDKLNDYTQYKNSADNILLENYIKSVLKEDSGMINKMSGDFLSVFGNVLEKEMMLIMLKIDRLSQLEKLDLNSKNLYKFSIMNVSEEIFDMGHTAKAIYMGGGKFVLLAFLQDISEDEKSGILWKDKIALLQKTMNEVAEISVSAYIGGYVHGSEALVHAYNIACTLSRYAIAYNREVLLDDSILVSHSTGAGIYDEQLEEDILDKVRTGNTEGTKNLFEQLITQSSKGDIENFMLSITRFSLALGKTIEIMNKSRIEKIQISTKDFYLRLADFESLDDIKEWFYGLIENITEKKVQVETRHDALVESVKKYINDNYTKELGLKGIAVEFKLSQGYLGMIFKDCVGTSVLDYINNIKLEKAVALIEETDLSIAEIMGRTGFLNEGNFYKLFKKKFGVTPKVYRIDRKVINILKE